jgi:SPP1 gp7 family putative phage head morphogenesis protein
MTQISPIAELEATRLLGLFKYSEDQPRDEKGLLKAAPSLPPADPDDQSEAAKRARRNIKKEVGDTLDVMRDRVPGEAADAYEANDNADEAMDAINLDDFDDLATGAIPTALHDVYVNAGQKALDSLQVDDTAIVDLFNKRAADYARERAAEMVGKRWVNDALVDNPNAKWAISQTTRDGLHDMIVKSYEDGKTPVQLAKQIEDSYLFSESRAQMIASTETAKASVSGSLGAWKESGVVKGKAWQMSNDHDQDDECDENEDAGIIDLDDDFPSGDDGPPAHPRCMCAVYASLEGSDDDDAEKLAKSGETVKLVGGQLDQAPTDDSTLKATSITSLQAGSAQVQKFSDDQPRVPAGGPGGGEFAGSGSAGDIAVQFVPSERVQRAIASKVHTGKAEQHVADESERVLSEAIGIPRTGDNSAFDVRNDEVAIECKCFTTNSNDKLTINKTALGRKLAEQRAEGLKVYTVVVDRRSGWKAGNPMGHATYYVKQGVGSFHLGSMTKVTLPQLKAMVHG